MSGVPTSFLFPSGQPTARAVSIAAWSSGVIIPEWDQPNIWTWANSQFASANIAAVVGSGGFSAVTIDGSGTAWMPQYYGSVVSYSPGNVFAIWPSFNDLLLGAAYVSAYNNVYYVGASGDIYSYVSSGIPLLSQTGGILLSQTGQPLLSQNFYNMQFGSFGCLTYGLATSGTTLFTMCASVSAIGTFGLTSIASGVSGSISLPFPIPLCLAASSPASSVSVGGMTYAALPNNYVAVAGSPISPILVAINDPSSTVDIYDGLSWPAWTYSQSVTASPNPTYVAWGTNGLSFAISDPVAQQLWIYNYIFNIPSFAQIINIPNAGPLVYVSANNILIIQPASGFVTSIYGSFNRWSVSNQLSISGITSIAASISYQAVAGIPSGIAYLVVSPTTNNVSLIASVSLPFTPQSVAADQTGLNSAVGTVGQSGYLTILNGSNLVQTFSWVGSGTSVAVYRDQIVVADASVPCLRTFGFWQNQYQQLSVIPTVPSGLSSLTITPVTRYFLGSTIFTFGSGAPWEYQFVSPWGVSNLPNGVVGTYTSGWATTFLGNWEKPAAITYDQSGNLAVTTLQNNLYSISPTGGIISSLLISTYTGQLSGVPLGISGLVASGSTLYGSSSLNGALISLGQQFGPPWIS